MTVDDGNRERYREHFAAVFSDFYVFDTLLGLPVDGPQSVRYDQAENRLHVQKAPLASLLSGRAARPVAAAPQAALRSGAGMRNR